MISRRIELLFLCLSVLASAMAPCLAVMSAQPKCLMDGCGDAEIGALPTVCFDCIQDTASSEPVQKQAINAQLVAQRGKADHSIPLAAPAGPECHPYPDLRPADSDPLYLLNASLLM